MKKVLVRGPVLTRSGYGEHVRFILRSLKKLEDKIDLYIIPLGWGHTGWVVDKDDEREWLDRLIQKTTMAINQSKHANQPFSVDIFDSSVHT
jgi:glutathionyl-hydroquinone reductase